MKTGEGWALVEKFYEDDGKTEIFNGAYSIILNGENRKDIVHSLQLMVLDTFTDKEIHELDKMFSVRKEVRKK